MNKKELVEKIAMNTKTTPAEAKRFLNVFIELIQKSMKKGEPVKLFGFGVYSVTRRAAREGRNPRNGETIQIPAKNVVKFKPSKALNDAL